MPKTDMMTRLYIQAHMCNAIIQWFITMTHPGFDKTCSSISYRYPAIKTRAVLQRGRQGCIAKGNRAMEAKSSKRVLKLTLRAVLPLLSSM